MNQLTECPECNAHMQEVNEIVQQCEICGYWTETGTARLDSLMVFA
ncbi:hypothetical protein HWN40_05855 [Methanolobus zinderi]|uniref:Uncharacterized protein n=1 Tax=Methanolobus zinderi TaxID=536044 RepID=A0A7D5I8G7_9EURY|nr:hypothetical protein [Methanolobus zinderi]KXS40358.1 MAG: hypothetical protein AWU59_2562 [Methanolobus sp. T82-4]QLC49802.1 hypothetical protein HWN40_05855 [Methanolobus zinderi]